jgi:acyl carrier protein
VPAETHTQRVPLDRAAVSSLLREQIGDVLGVESSAIDDSSTFVDDLGADSLALMTLVESIEDELGERSVGFHLDDEDLSDLETVGDVVDYVLNRLAAH